jgi:hypothetical protein
MVLGLAAALLAQSAERAGGAGRVDLETLRTPIYTPEGTAIVRHNGDRFNNRPLYCNQTSAIVVAGDRPLIRCGNGSVLNGSFMAALVRGNKAKWLHDWSDITSKYRPDRMEWTLKDGGFGATVVTLDAVPPADGAGMAVRVRIENAETGDRLIWAFGGAVQQKESVLGAWDVTTGGRLHEDSWLYAIFCPIDAGMLPTDLAAKSLYYTEWGLERESMPYGGQRCWTSNWVPSVWSLREMWPGDNYALALAYFQTGLADDGWTVLRGTFPLMAFYGPVPGDLGHTAGGTDFNDCASTFCRTLVGQMMLDPRHKAPAIDLAGAAALVDGASRLRTPQGVPFAWSGGERNIAFTSMWDNWPRQIAVPVGRKAEGIWLLVCGYTNPMQGRIANAELRMKNADGAVERLELVPPFNFWSMCPFGRADYDYKRDGFCLPKVPPQAVQLGANCRAILLNLRLRPDAALESVTLEALSQEVIVGLMGASLMNPR